MSPVWIEVKDLDSHRENLRKNHVISDIAERTGTHSGRERKRPPKGLAGRIIAGR